MEESLTVKLVINNSEIGEIDFSKIIGQESVKNKILFYLNSHKSTFSMPTLLFDGSHGLGKTYTASIVAKNMNRRFVDINCKTIQTVENLIEDVILNKIAGKTPVTLLLDEAHCLSKDVSAILLTLLSPSSKQCNMLEYKGLSIEYDMSKINVILATTNSFEIFSPLLNRCEKIYFGAYSNEELFSIVKFYLPSFNMLAVNIDSCPIDDIAYACRGRARDAFVLANKIQRYCSIYKINEFLTKDWENIKKIFEIYPMGLNKQEVELIKIVKENGPISCANIGMMMMVNESNILEEVEIRPRELGFLTNTSRGRVLSEKGFEYFEKLQKTL